MSEFWAGLLIFAVIVLLPLVPALLLYAFAPRQVAKGPFRGLNIKLTGAAVTYFVVLMAAMPLGMRIQLPKDPPPAFYVLRGALEMDGIKTRNDFDERLMMITLLPKDEAMNADPSGVVTFSLNVKASPDGEEAVNWPFRRVMIEYPGHRPAFLSVAEAVRRDQQEFEFDGPAKMTLIGDN